MRFLRRTGRALFATFFLLLGLGCGNQYRPVANPIVGPGGQPQPTHYAYVVNYSPIGDGSTTRIDVSGDSVTRVQTVGLGSNSEAFLSPSQGALFVANGGDDTVSEYALSGDDTITTINLLSGSHPVALSSTQSGVMYVLNSGPNSLCQQSGSISTINTATLAVSNTTTPPPCVGVDPIAMVQATGGGRVFVINRGDNSVWVYDPPSQTIVARFTTQANPKLGPTAKYLAASADGFYIFVVTQGDGVNPGALDIIDVNNFGVLPSVPLGVKPTFAVVDPNLNRLYVTNSGSNTVSVFDASNVNISNPKSPIPLLGTANVGAGPVSVTALPDGTRFYVANSGSNDVTDVSATSFAALGTIPLPSGANPVWIASEPTSSKVYVANQSGSSTTIIQTSNDAVATNIPAPAQDPNCTSSCALQQPVMIITQ
jgi:DNA-binding beta-propeller fold protein YncE